MKKKFLGIKTKKSTFLTSKILLTRVHNLCPCPRKQNMNRFNIYIWSRATLILDFCYQLLSLLIVTVAYTLYSLYSSLIHLFLSEFWPLETLAFNKNAIVKVNSVSEWLLAQTSITVKLKIFTLKLKIEKRMISFSRKSPRRNKINRTEEKDVHKWYLAFCRTINIEQLGKKVKLRCPLIKLNLKKSPKKQNETHYPWVIFPGKSKNKSLWFHHMMNLYIILYMIANNLSNVI